MRRGEGDIVRRRISSSPLPFSQSSSFKRKLRGNKVKNCPLRLRTYLADRLNQMINQRPRLSKCFFISSERKLSAWLRSETFERKRPRRREMRRNDGNVAFVCAFSNDIPEDPGNTILPHACPPLLPLID